MTGHLEYRPDVAARRDGDGLQVVAILRDKDVAPGRHCDVVDALKYGVRE